VLRSSLGCRRLLARANHARDRASECDLRLLSICEHERVPWTAIRTRDLQQFMAAIATWDDCDYAQAIDAIASTRGGFVVALQREAPAERLHAFGRVLRRIAVCERSPTRLTRDERNLVLSGPQDLDVDSHGVRIVGLHQLHRKLASGAVRMERLASFRTIDTAEQEVVDPDARAIDSCLLGLSERVVHERRGRSLTQATLAAAGYAERVLPWLFEYWLERSSFNFCEEVTT